MLQNVFAFSAMWYILKDKIVEWCVRMWTTVLKLSFWEVNCCFMFPLSHPHKTKFMSIKPKFTSTKDNFEYRFSLYSAFADFV